MIHGVNINREVLISILLSLYEVIAININLDIIKGKNGGDLLLLIRDYTGSFHGFSIIHFFEWYCFYRVVRVSIPYIKKHVNTFRDYVCISIPAAVFSLSMIIGFSFLRKHSLELFWGSSLQILKSFTAFTGYFLLFAGIIICIFLFFDYIIFHLHDSDSSKNNILFKYPFVCPFLVLIIVSIPYIVFSYPGILITDSEWQIKQMINAYMFNGENGLIFNLDTIKLHNHHPILHTFFIHVFIFVGKLITNSYNIGLFVYTLFQSLCVIASISFVMYIVIKKLHVNPIIAFASLLYYALHPYIQQMMALCSKDTLYSVCFILFVSVSFTKLLNCTYRYQNSVWFLLAIGTILFRNEGIFVLLPMMGYWILFGENKLPLKYPVCAAILFFLVHLVVFPFLRVTPGSIREALSIPFQQTARYVKYAGEDISDEEKRAISRILSFDKLAEKYKAEQSDPVKNTFNEKATKSELFNYAMAWWDMLKKHPAIYVEAVLDNKYDYYYPSHRLGYEFWCGSSQKCMNRINQTAHTDDFGHPKSFAFWRDYYFSLHTHFFQLPILGIAYSPAMYIWICIIWLSFCIKRKSNHAILLLVPFLMQLFVNIAGPTNGIYFRYMCVFVVGLLPVIIYGLEIIRLEKCNTM